MLSPYSERSSILAATGLVKWRKRKNPGPSGSVACALSTTPGFFLSLAHWNTCSNTHRTEGFFTKSQPSKGLDMFQKGENKK